MKKKIFLRLLGLFSALTVLLQSTVLVCSADVAVLSPSARSAVLIDAHSGKVLYEKNAYSKMGMASTTKIMTALTVLRLASLSDTVSIPKEAVGTEGSSVYLCEGEELTVEQLLYALMLASANDAAVTLALFCSGSIEAFADEMNGYARELGLCDTHFTNPHGLYDEMHYTTAYDLALITKEALGVDAFRRIASTYKMTLPFDGEPDKRLVVNHNKLLRSYDGAIGVKTGYTKDTGRCLVSAAEREGLTLIAVTLDAPDDWRDHTAMLDYGFARFERRTVAEAGELCVSFPVTGSDTDTVTLTNAAPIVLTLERTAASPKISVCSTHRFLYAPVPLGKQVANAVAESDGEVCSVPLKVCQSVSAKEHKNSFFDRLLNIF